MSRSILVLGGARSGKSAYAEQLAAAHMGEKIYIATAEAIDAEMAERIAHHRARRGEGWRTLDAPLDVAGVLRREDGRGRFVLVDCVTVWISNLMFHNRDVEDAVAEVCAVASGVEAQVVFVSNEVGFGIVPDNALARSFRDMAGRANQALAASADEVVLVVAGLPLTLKQAKPR